MEYTAVNVGLKSPLVIHGKDIVLSVRKNI